MTSAAQWDLRKHWTPDDIIERCAAVVDADYGARFGDFIGE